MRPWPRYPRYIVSADGTIIGPSGRVLKPHLIGPPGRKCGSIGVHTLGTSRTTPGRTKKWKIATVVCETFHGPRPDGMHVAHRDGNALNDAASNLAWKTPADNEADKVLHGTSPARGENCNLSKLTESQVRDIRYLRHSGATTISIAAKFGITTAAVSKIANRQTWRHI